MLVGRIGRIDDSRGAGLERRPPLRRIDVGDDRTGLIERKTQAHRGKSKAARADDHERALGIDGSGFLQRAEGGETGTAEGRRERRRERFIFDEKSRMIDEDIVAEAAIGAHAEVLRLGAQVLFAFQA